MDGVVRKFMVDQPPLLLIRADASARIGTGHVMRCLALAQAWADYGGRAAFACAEIPLALADRLRKEGFPVHAITAAPGSVHDAEQTMRLVSTFNATAPAFPSPRRSGPSGWVVADGYHFDLPFQRAVRASGTKLLLIDDYGILSGYEADLLLNQNIDADAYNYSSIPVASRLLGPRYALLRRHFATADVSDREVPAVARNVLVTLGGADPNNITGLVVKAIQASGESDLRVRVLVGPAFRHKETLESAIREDQRFEILSCVENMPEMMRWADMAVSAGGSTVWELLRMGVPSLILDIADNQRSLAAELGKRNFAVHVSSVAELTEECLIHAIQNVQRSHSLRAELSRRGPILVDGWGADRVVMHLLQKPIRLRPWFPSDAQLIWELANEPTVRANSFHPESISWEAHIQWFSRRLKDRSARSYLAVDGSDTPVAQIRFDIEKTHSVISCSVAKPYRGRGLGKEAVRQACRKHFVEEKDVDEIWAFIKHDNKASRHLFSRCGFVFTDRICKCGVPAELWKLKREMAV